MYVIRFYRIIVQAIETIETLSTLIPGTCMSTRKVTGSRTQIHQI